jgi:hypothetical protein
MERDVERERELKYPQQRWKREKVGSGWMYGSIASVSTMKWNLNAKWYEQNGEREGKNGIVTPMMNGGDVWLGGKEDEVEKFIH